MSCATRRPPPLRSHARAAAGVEYRGLPVVAVADVVAAHVTEPTEDDLAFQPPPLPPGAEQLAAAVEGLCLFVCALGATRQRWHRGPRADCCVRTCVHEGRAAFPGC